VCRLVIPIPTKGADAFPPNSFASNMLNILSIENPHSCTNCEDRQLASARCLDCVENLCDGCVMAHERIRQTKSHRVVSFEELQNNTVDESIRCPSFCKIHDREVWILHVSEVIRNFIFGKICVIKVYLSLEDLTMNPNREWQTHYQSVI